MEILNRSELPLSRSGGAREYRLVTGPNAAGEGDGGGWVSVGGLVCLSDCRCAAGGEIGTREHRNLDLVTLVVDGRLEHRGSLNDGALLQTDEVIVQCAGAAGFAHNEINPDDQPNRVVRLGLVPERQRTEADWRQLPLQKGRVTRVYGGDGQRHAAPAAATGVDIAFLDGGQSLDVDTPFMAYLVSGAGFANEDHVTEGTLFRDDQLTFDATEDTRLVIVHRRV